MVGWYEIVGERNDPGKVGRVRVNTFYETRKKPLWWIGVKLLGLVAMVAVGLAMFVPFLPLAMWQNVAAVLGGMLVYVGLAFFLRPEPNEDNMGFVGGLFNDPTHYSDNINRTLWQFHCLLGPGRFAAGTLLDVCTWLGLTAEITAEQAQVEDQQRHAAADDADRSRWQQEALEKVRERQEGLPGGELELSSARYLDPDRFD